MSWSRSVFPTDYASGYAWALCIVELWSSFSRNSCWWIHEERWLWMISSSRNRWTSWRRSSSSGLQSRGEGHLVQQLNRKSQPRSLDQAAHRGLTHHGSSTLTSQSRHQPAKESMRLSTIKGKLQNFGGPGALGAPLLVWPSELMYLFIEVQPAVQGTNCGRCTGQFWGEASSSSTSGPVFVPVVENFFSMTRSGHLGRFPASHHYFMIAKQGPRSKLGHFQQTTPPTWHGQRPHRSKTIWWIHAPNAKEAPPVSPSWAGQIRWC